MNQLSRRALGALEKQPLHIARNATKADVFRFEWPPGSGRFAVVKDMRARPAWFRLGAGRLFLMREYRALRALQGIEGVPRALGRPDFDALVMEWHAGAPVMKRPAGDMPVAALEEVARIVAAAHARGVTHGDLHRSNVLLDENGRVTLIDWATAGVFGSQRRGLKAITFQEWCALDVRAIAKLKARHAPQLLSPQETEVLLHGSKIYRLVRNAGFHIRRALGHQRAKPAEFASARYQKFIENAQTEKPGETR